MISNNQTKTYKNIHKHIQTLKKEEYIMKSKNELYVEIEKWYRKQERKRDYHLLP